MKISENPRVAIAGSVNSSLQTLRKLYEHKLNVVHVFGLHPEVASKVSGYQDLKKEGEELGYESSYFKNINDIEVVDRLKPLRIDLLFVVGLSQLVREPLISLAKAGNVGFHPTRLPKGRGRGALAWITLGKAPGAASFFLLDEGMDSGPILGQKDFDVAEEDYAQDVLEKIKNTIDEVLDLILPKLKEGKLVAEEQNHDEATYLGVRRPKDGRINWNCSAKEVRSIIRATSHPLPGAFTIYDSVEVKVFRAELKPHYTGIPGRIIDMENGKPIVCCQEGALLLSDLSSEIELSLKVGKEFI